MVTVSLGKTSVPFDGDVIVIDGLSTTSSATTFNIIIVLSVSSLPASSIAIASIFTEPASVGIVTLTEPLSRSVETNVSSR